MIGRQAPKERTPVRIHVIREPGYTPMTARKREVCWDFGIPPREEPFSIAEGLTLTLRPGTIILLTGPSGSGKSSVLGEIVEQVGDVVSVGHGRFPVGRSVVDAIAPRKPLAAALEILTACGLGEPRLWIRQYADLSDGEKFRASLARAVGASLSRQSPVPIVCDEFTSILHRRAAKAIAYNLRKLVTRHGLTLVVATTHEDVIQDLQPDQTIHLGGPSPLTTLRHPTARAATLRRRATVERGSVSDYRTFSPMHYRHRDGLGFVDKVFLLKESPRGEPLGILVFAHAPLELAQRNRVTGRRFVRNPRRLNRELRILRRLVMHPDVRGCGLGHWFVERTLPKVGVRFVECLAAMGAVNPVFERAGMHRVGRCPLPRGRLAMLRRMTEWGVDPFDEGFTKQIARYPRVRKMVEDTIRRWAATTQGGRQYRVEGRPVAVLATTFRQLIGEPPQYYLWDKRGIYPRKDPSTDAEGKTASAVRPRRRSQPSHDADETKPTARRHSPDVPDRRRHGATRRPAGGRATRQP